MCWHHSVLSNSVKGRREVFAILARRDAEDSYESRPHLLLVRETAVFSNCRDSIRYLLKPTAGCVDAYRFDSICGCATARLRIKSREVPETHMHTFRERLNPAVAFQVFGDPLLQFAEHVRI